MAKSSSKLWNDIFFPWDWEIWITKLVIVVILSVKKEIWKLNITVKQFLIQSQRILERGFQNIPRDYMTPNFSRRPFNSCSCMVYNNESLKKVLLIWSLYNQFNPIRPGVGYFFPTHQFIYDISGNIDGTNIIFCDFS